MHRPLDRVLLLVSFSDVTESTIPGLVNGARVPPGRAVSCGWKRADWVLAFRAMLRQGDLELTRSKYYEGGLRWLTAESGGGAWVVWCKLGIFQLKACLLGVEAGPGILGQVSSLWVSLSRLEQSFGVSAASWGPRQLTSTSAYCAQPCARRSQGAEACLPGSTRVLSD